MGREPLFRVPVGLPPHEHFDLVRLLIGGLSTQVDACLVRRFIAWVR